MECVRYGVEGRVVRRVYGSSGRAACTWRSDGTGADVLLRASAWLGLPRCIGRRFLFRGVQAARASLMAARKLSRILARGTRFYVECSSPEVK